MLSPKEMILAARLLQSASNEFANHGCNDWKFPHTWNQEEKEEFVKAFHDYNGDPEEFNPEWLNLHDYAVMSFLADKLLDGSHELIRKVHAKIGGEVAFKVAANICDDSECCICAEIFCPHGHELHFHHDGCPACAEDD